MKSVVGFVIVLILSGCSVQSWSRIDCPDFKGRSRQDISDLFQRMPWSINGRIHGHRTRHPAKGQRAMLSQREMKNMEVLKSGIQFSNERMNISIPMRTASEWKPTVSENVKTKKIFQVKKFVRNIRGQTVIRPGGMSSETAAQDKRQIPFAAVLGILSLGFTALGWLLLLSAGGYAVFLGLIGALGGFISILVGLYGINKEWKRAARWAILLGILAILLNPITFFIATYGA